MTASELADHLELASQSVTPILGGASAKQLFRVRSSAPQVAIVFESDAEFEEYLNITTCLSGSQIPVPFVHRFDPLIRLVLIDDLGTDTLTIRAVQDIQACEAIYNDLINIILRIQDIQGDSIAHRRSFDGHKYRFEHDFHVIDRLIAGHFRYSLSADDHAVLDAFFEQLVAPILKQPQVLVHRDFQSSNVLLLNNTPVLIDYQDARLGNPWYDLVALLEDAYVAVPDYWKSTFMEQYATESGRAFDQHLYDCTVIQRKLHDAGAFAFCYQKLGNSFYLKYIEPVFMHAVNTMARYDSWSSACGIFLKVLDHGRQS